MSAVVELAVQGERIELLGYGKGATLSGLAEAVEAIRVTPGLITASCRGCGGCCAEAIPVLGLDLGGGRGAYSLALPGPPDRAERRHAVEQLAAEHELSREQAALLYDHNNAEPITLSRSCGRCDNLSVGLCTIYGRRPYACRLYVCNMGERLEGVYEGIVALGTWHAYHVLGWIDEGDIAGNPFLGAGGYHEVPVEAFEANLRSALESLFFYF
jgi:Fe-S-cluster containining protein